MEKILNWFEKKILKHIYIYDFKWFLMHQEALLLRLLWLPFPGLFQTYEFHFQCCEIKFQTNLNLIRCYEIDYHTIEILFQSCVEFNFRRTKFNFIKIKFKFRLPKINLSLIIKDKSTHLINPPLNPSESIVLWEHYRLWVV